MTITPRFRQWHQARSDEEEAFDRQLGVDTAGIVYPALEVSLGSNRFHGNFYLGTLPSEFEAIMLLLPIEHKEYHFVDYGSGKGRALLLASNWDFKSIVGIEYAPELHAIAKRNLEIYTNTLQRCFSLSVLCMDAAEYMLPNQPTVIFMHNPFGKKVIDAVLDAICHSIFTQRRDMWIIYQYPAIPEPFEDADWLSIFISTPEYIIYRVI